MKKSYRHSDQFWENKLEEIKKWANDRGIINPITNKEQLQLVWEDIKERGTKNVDRELKYSLQYNTKYKTALAQYKMLRNNKIDEDIKLRDLKKLEHSEFLDKYGDIINQMYEDYKGDSKNPEVIKEASQFISLYWFGSE